MDEPLSNLDAKLRVQARAELTKLHQRLGTTFIYVTHDQVEAMTMGTRIAILNQGVLQQVDSPQHLYERPANVFVAGFLGSPSMNFFEAVVVGEDGGLLAKTNDFKLPLTSSSPLLKDYLNRPVILGIRPEAIYHPDFQPPGIRPVDISARVSVVERMGHELIVYFALTEEQEFVARLDPRANVAQHQTVRLRVDTQRLHIFDPDTQQSIA